MMQTRAGEWTVKLSLLLAESYSGISAAQGNVPEDFKKVALLLITWEIIQVPLK